MLGKDLQLKTTTLFVFFLWLAKIIDNMIVDHLEECGLFSGFQYGFRSSGSTADLLTVVCDRIARDLTGLVVLVLHAGLLHKRNSSGILGKIFDLISSFLSNRRL